MAIIGIFAVIVLAILGIPLAYSLLFISIVIILFGLQQPASLIKLGTATFAAFYNMTWVPLPLFILLAYIINETAIATDILAAANKWLSRIPGGLVVSSVFGEAMMAAAIGSSSVTILSVGKVALPEMERLNYKRDFSLGALLAAGVLGPLIPPSIPLVVYGIIAQQDIGKLLVAGIVPGVILAFMLAGWSVITCVKHPNWAPLPSAVTWGDRLMSIRKVWPIILVMVAIIGSIYLGIATAAEAAGIGVVISLLIAIVSYKFRLRNLFQAMSETATLIGMIGLMIVAATVFTFSIGISGLAQSIADFIMDMGLSPWFVIIAINIVIIIAGCIMDTLAIVLVTVPIFVPVIIHLGFDPIWFGIVMVVNTEIGLITPPIGLNTFITSQVFKISIFDLLRGVFPFLMILLIFLVITIAFPELSLWLPGLMK
jgi:tripartite ATP-independent transporter DctM subunit